jgi:hypothetical protein
VRCHSVGSAARQALERTLVGILDIPTTI